MRKNEKNDDKELGSSFISSASEEDKDLTGSSIKINQKKTVKERIYGLNGSVVKKATKYFALLMKPI